MQIYVDLPPQRYRIPPDLDLAAFRYILKFNNAPKENNNMRIKYAAVIVATLVHFFLGGLWYSPLLFGNKFLQIIAWTPQQLAAMQAKGPAKELIIAFVSSLILVYILAHFVQYTKATNAMAGIQTAFWLWLGFIATTNIATVLFEQRPLGLFLINMSYQLVACMIAGAILAVWRPQEAASESAVQAV